MSENPEMGSKGGEVKFHFVSEKKPPLATKLLIINKGGCLLVSDWKYGLGHRQWSHPPKKRTDEPSMQTLEQHDNGEPNE